MLLGKMLAASACESTEKHVSFFPSYGAEQRGGTANCYVVISDEEIGAPLGDHMDDLIVFNQASLDKFLYKLKPGGTLFVNSSIASGRIGRGDVKVVCAPVTEMALKLGSPKVLNVIMLGVYIGFTRVLPEGIILKTLRDQLAKKADLIPLNERAFAEGLAIGKAA